MTTTAVSTAPGLAQAPAVPAQPPSSREEALAELARMAHRRFGRIPPELVARHVLAIHPMAEWPILRAALEALLRRWTFAERDGLRVVRSNAAAGRWQTRASGGQARPYDTVLWRVDPPQGSCGCADFRRGSLGLCKHLLVVLAHLAANPGRWKRACAAKPIRRPLLQWDPVRPLHGNGDWLERVHVESKPARELPAALRRRMVRTADGSWRPGDVHRDDAPARLQLVRALERQNTAEGGAPTADPALAGRLSDERGELERIVTLERARPRLLSALRGLRRALFPYQRIGVERFLARGRLLLADDMGLGKTMQAVAICHVMSSAGFVRRGLLLVPAALKAQWLAEWQCSTATPCALVEGSATEREELYRTTTRGFLIANYEQALRDLDAILAWAPDLVVLDEAQRIKNWEAKTAHAVKRLAPAFRLVLTGTPMQNRLEELASLYDWVDDHALEPKWRLAPFHAMPAPDLPPVAGKDGKTAGRGVAPVGARHLDTLRARVAATLLRRTRAEVLTDLPSRTDTRVAIQLTPAQAEAHADLDRPIASLLSRAARRPLTREEFLRLMTLLDTQRRIANGLALRDFQAIWPEISGRRPSTRLLETLDAPKLVELREIVRALAGDQGRKIVVFSQWKRMLLLARWAVSDVLEEHGLSAAFFTGGQSSRQRTQSIVDFHDEPDTRLLFLTDAGGVGLNLQRAASACILLELPWNPAVLEQRVGRIHRLGQREPIQVYSLVSRDCIEERIAAVVADKRALFRGLFDGTSDAVQFERSASFLDTLQGLSAAAPPAARLEPEEPPPCGTAPADDADSDTEVGRDTAQAEPEADEPEAGELEAAGGVLEAKAEMPTAVPNALDPFRDLRVERRPDGSLRIEAPPGAAAVLASAFETLARLMREAAPR